MAEIPFAGCSRPYDCALWKLLEATRELAAPITVEEILQKVITAALYALDADRGSIFLYDAKTHELYTKVSTGTNDVTAPAKPRNDSREAVPPDAIYDIRFSADMGIAGETLRLQRPVNVPDCYADPRFNPDVDRATGYISRCLLSVPLSGIDNTQIGVLQVLNKRGGIFSQEDEQIALTLAAHCAVALQRAALIQEHIVKQKMEQDLALAREIQLAALPKDLPVLAGYEIVAWSKPAEETGGDIYDAIALDSHRAGLLMADATGHGIGPALSASQLRAMFRMGLLLEADLGDMLSRINSQLKTDLPLDRFITAFAAILDSVEHKIFYHSWGQAPLLHYHAKEDRLEWLEASTLPMGILDNPPAAPPSPRSMRPGDIFALISDGFFEYENDPGDQFGREKTGEIIRMYCQSPLDQIRIRLQNSIENFAEAAAQVDDMTLLMVRRKRQ